MSKVLKHRLQEVKGLMDRAERAVAGDATKLADDVRDWFLKTLQFRLEVDHWLALIETRSAALELLADLERQVDSQDRVAFGNSRTSFQVARLIGVQSYLTTTWAIADRMSALVGRVMCEPNIGTNPKNSPKLVQHFLRSDTLLGVFSKSIARTFGWPIAISYAIRNHVVHDGAQILGLDFFDGPSASAAFRLSELGWKRITDAAQECRVTESHHRAADWPTSPRDDLRVVLRVCEREMDDALGVLLGSAGGALQAHVGFMLGQD